MTILFAILTAIFGAGITYVVCRFLPQRQVRQANAELARQEDELRAEISRLEQERDKTATVVAQANQQAEEYYNSIFHATQTKLELALEKLSSDYEKQSEEAKQEYLNVLAECGKTFAQKTSKLESQRNSIQNEIANLEQQKTLLANHLLESKQRAEETAKTQLALIQERLDKSAEELAKSYQADVAEQRKALEESLVEYTQMIQANITKVHGEYALANEALIALKHTVDLATEAAKREEEKKNKENFYRMVLPASDIKEIECLRQVEPLLRDKEALNKVIWKVYYEKPLNEMIGRVLGDRPITGIYKITSIATGKCYVGQARETATRWRQHAKRAIGAETPTRNKLYPAMKELGPENFTFELVEECSPADLDVREDYWQEYFHAKDYGYSIK